jgi:thiamine-phosphate pyrophosphorylase
MRSLKSYLITDPALYSADPVTFSDKVSRSFAHYAPDFACFRDKVSPNAEALASLFVHLAREFDIKNVLINTQIDLALALKADGVHLPSSMIMQTPYAKECGLFVICSTHNEAEARRALECGADAITYSPIFASPGKGKPKGLSELKEINDKIRADIFALGGIVTKEHVQQLQHSKVYGFASIRYFNV